MAERLWQNAYGTVISYLGTVARRASKDFVVGSEGACWLVRDKRRFLLAIMEEFAGSARVGQSA